MNLGMIKKIQKLQKEMEKTQGEIHESVFSASANGVVDVEVKGDKTILNITVNKEAIDSIDDLELVLESVKVAINNANNEIDNTTQEKMKKYAALAGMGF